MSGEEFLRLLEEVKENLRIIEGGYKDTKKWKKLNKITSEVDYFNFRILQDGTIDIYYDSDNMLSMIGYFQLEDQKIVLPLMSFYTNISCKILDAKLYINKKEYERLCVEKQKIGEAVRKMCVREFSEIVVTKEKLKRIKRVLEWSIPQLYHCIGKIGEYSEEFNLQSARKLSKIRSIYQSFKVGTKWVYYYDEILGTNRKIPIDGAETAYAVSMLFCTSYTTSIIWLKKYYPSGQWCPVVPWNILQRFAEEIYELYR